GWRKRCRDSAARPDGAAQRADPHAARRRPLRPGSDPRLGAAALWPRRFRARLRRNPRLGWTALALDRNIAGSARGDVADGHSIPLNPGRDNALAAAPCRIDAGARI